MKKVNKPHVFLTVLIFLFGAIFVTSFVSCTRPTTSKSAPHPSVYAVLDASKSDRDGLGTAVISIAELGRFLPPETTQQIYRIDNRLGKIYEGPAIGSDEAFFDEIVPSLAPVSDRDYTFIDKVFVNWVKAAKSAQGRIAFIIATDWHCEGMDAEAHQRVKDAAKALAANPNVVSVVVIGVDPVNSDRMTEELSALRPKLRTPVSSSSPDLSFVAKELTQ